VIDALGRPQSVLLIGGTSEIGLAIVRALPAGRLRRVVLLGRDEAALAKAAAGLRAGLQAEGGAAAEVAVVAEVDVQTAVTRACDTDAHGAVVDGVFDAGDIDVVVLAMGALGDQHAAEADPRLAVETAQATFVGPLSLMLHAGRRLGAQGHGVLVVLSSVAGRQARRRNYVYGAAKAGLDLAALGLGDQLHGSGAQVVVVRPGFVRTRMTAGLPPPPLAIDVDGVARAVVAGIRAGRTVVYAPAAFRAVSAALVVMPRALLRRLRF
jgi:decaprenylphospho-beta-D-erythro-pentofuranosid-2-ulose 2-reductase